MNQKRKAPDHHRPRHPPLPPIIQEDDGEYPFFKQDFFSDVAILAVRIKLFYFERNISSRQAVSGHYRPARETPFEWRFASGPMVASLRLLLGLIKYSNLNVIMSLLSATVGVAH